MGKQGYNGKSSKNFANGSNPHIGAPRSQSGSPQYGSSPKPSQSGGKNSGGYNGPSALERLLFGNAAKKKNKKGLW